MIILIAGASHTGKTLLAQRLLETYHYPYLSIDHLEMGLIRSGQTTLTPMDDEELVGYLWPIVREMIKTAVENRQNLIVEGCYIPTNALDHFEEEYKKQLTELERRHAMMKKDNEDARAFLASLDNMLKNRLTADGISRFNELLQGYLNYSDAIGEDLGKFGGEV